MQFVLKEDWSLQKKVIDFDLVRWGIAAQYINTYLQTEQTRGIGSVEAGAKFTAGTNEYFPIPQQEIILDPSLKQNLGY